MSRSCSYKFPDVTASGEWEWHLIFLNKECPPSKKHSIWGIWARLSFFSPLLCLAIVPDSCLVEAPSSLLSDCVFVSRGRWEVWQTARGNWRSHSEVWQHCTENWRVKVPLKVVKNHFLHKALSRFLDNLSSDNPLAARPQTSSLWV